MLTKPDWQQMQLKDPELRYIDHEITEAKRLLGRSFSGRIDWRSKQSHDLRLKALIRQRNKIEIRLKKEYEDANKQYMESIAKEKVVSELLQKDLDKANERCNNPISSLDVGLEDLFD
jgi:superfamily II RNA helicase